MSIKISNLPPKIGDSGISTGDIPISIGGVTYRVIPSQLFSGSTINGFGGTNFVTKWTNSTTLTNSIIYDNGTKVGIGTSSPTSALTVNGYVLANGYAVPSGLSTSFLMADGSVNNTTGFYWSASTGVNSVVTVNTNNTAGGDSALAEGNSNSAFGDYSHAEGYNTQANGFGSHAEGQFTIALGISSHVEGSSATANGDYSHAENSGTAFGVSSHAEGGAVTYGQFAHAEGWNGAAYGYAAHTEGESTVASGSSSHAEGYGSQALGNYSHAEGYVSQALGDNSHAEGYLTIAGINCHAEGNETISSGDTSHAEGYQTIANGFMCHAEGYSTQALGNLAHAEGDTSIASGNTAHAEGSQTIAGGWYSHAEGQATQSIGDNSHAEGFLTVASGMNSHVGGVLSRANGLNSFVHGSGSTANGINTIVLGANITGNSSNTTYVENLSVKSGDMITIGSAPLTEDLQYMTNSSVSTGLFLFSNSGITSTASTTFNVGRVHGWIIPPQDILNTQPIFVQYAGGSGLTTPYLLSAPASYLSINSASTLTIQSTRPTVTDRRNNIYLGVVGHPNGTVTGIGNSPDIIMNEMSQVRAMFEPTRLINEGVTCYPNSTDMTVANTAGILYGLGIGFVTNGNFAPSILNVGGGSPLTFQYRTQTGTTFPNTTTASGGTYDVGGVNTVIGGSVNQATNQRIYLLQNGSIRFQFGQIIYGTLTDAIAAATNESFVVFSNNRNLGILIGILSIRKGATNLSNTADARFLPVSKFGETVGAAAGIAIGTLQTSYNNSSEPEIVTNNTLQALTIKRGSAADTDAILQGQNNAGTTNFSVLGNGTTSTTFLKVGTGTFAGAPAEIVISGGTPFADQILVVQNTNPNQVSGLVSRDDTGTKYFTMGMVGSTSTLGATYGLAGEGLIRASTSATGLSLIALNGPMRFSTGIAGSERIRINSVGAVLINTTGDTGLAQLQVNGAVSSSSRIFSTGGGDPYTGITNASLSVSGGSPRLSLVCPTNFSNFRVADVHFGVNTGINLRFRSDDGNSSFVGYNMLGAYTGITSHNWFTDSAQTMILNSTGLGIGTTTPNASAKLQVNSTTQGFLPPRMTAAQRLAISSPSIGLMVYQTDGTEGVYVNSSTGWRALAWV